MKTAAEILSDAGYDNDQIESGLDYADRHDWEDEDERGAYALARILYSDRELENSPKAGWEPCCYDDEEA